MKKKFDFQSIKPWPNVSIEDWKDWKWQMRKSFKKKGDFSAFYQLTRNEELGFDAGQEIFRVQSTPYYLALSESQNPQDSIRRMILPTVQEVQSGGQQMLDPLGENKQSNRATERLIHRYTDRVLFLATDMCGIYCRYCTRKHFTAHDQVMASEQQLAAAVDYVRNHKEIKEVIFSGGDPLTLSNSNLSRLLKAFYDIDHIELIRIGSRMPVVNPFRIDSELLTILKEFKPVYFMTHFNHPNEITMDSAMALESLVDNGVPVFNQLVLLNGINNHPALIYALSRRLLYLRVKPHYMFQADPSMGTDHLRTSIEDSLTIQKQLWGHTSGLAMPQLIVDIPDGGGKAAMVPTFLKSKQEERWSFEGWDGVQADYISPQEVLQPWVSSEYKTEWLNP